MPELLLPAGNFEKLRSAIRFGADAVYLAGKRFGMRAAASNFTNEELKQAVEYAHARGKKVYLTVNITPHVHEYEELEKYLFEIKDFKVDALIVADPGVFTAVRAIMPNTDIHISTQAGAVSHRDCLFWYNMGASRIVLARELSIDEIRDIRARIPEDLELECFIHGSMCVSFSGRCLLSNHFLGRDANRGCCAQPCRWDYKIYEIEEVKRPGLRFPVEEHENGTFIMSSKDMNMIAHIPELMELGISSFKIEGRMKSAYYAAVCANTYRMAMNAYAKDPDAYVFDPLWERELESVTHREYCSGYWFDDPLKVAQTVTVPGYLTEKTYLATVVSYDSETGFATLVQKNKFCVGDRVELLTPGKTGRAFVAEIMLNSKNEPIESCPHPFMEFKLKMPFEVKEGDILRSGSEL